MIGWPINKADTAPQSRPIGHSSSSLDDAARVCDSSLGHRQVRMVASDQADPKSCIRFLSPSPLILCLVASCTY